MSSRHSLYKSHADRVWPRAAERSPRTYKVRAMRRSLAFDGFFAAGVGGTSIPRRGAALHRVGCRRRDGGATRARQLAAARSCHHMMGAGVLTPGVGRGRAPGVELLELLCFTLAELTTNV